MKLDSGYWRHLPLVGVVIALALFYMATTLYPGGTSGSTSTLGFDWAQNFISTLFAPSALNGVENSARLFAIPVMLVLCVSIGVLFKSISNKSTSRINSKTIEIAGIGSAVYAFMVATPMHDLMVSIGLLFALTALLATLYLLYANRYWLLFWVGVICVVIKMVSATMYYGDVLFDLLPVMQKAGMAALIGWLVAVHYTSFDQQGGVPVENEL